MATPTSAPPLAERTDIHKSCKSLETLLNVLNEYCEAVGAVVALQKKLAKALRETAGSKVTGEIAANAMNASATIFEALYDIDTKFTKIADKEYDCISTEVKKWFKKLAKEEKGHDEKMANANAKIKQAGQVYEKKSKKKGLDVSEEHSRYINLISTLGPEISQEKYNHALNVTHRHTLTTYSVAACLSRLADAEWLKVCEGTRRFAPTIGHLGEWRALCEGGWSGPVPRGLPDPDEPRQPETDIEATTKVQNGEDTRQAAQAHVSAGSSETRGSTDPPEQNRPPPGYSAIQHDVEPPPQRDPPSPSPRSSPTLQRQSQPISNPPPSETFQNLSPPTSFDTLRPPFIDANTGSVRSLSAFPAPPTHFPIPPPRQHQQSFLSHSVQSSTSNLPFPSTPQISESPISAGDDPLGIYEREAGPSTSQQSLRHPESWPASESASPEQRFQNKPKEIPSERPELVNLSSMEIRRPLAVRAQTSLPTTRNFRQEEDVFSPSDQQRVVPVANSSRERADPFDDGHEFGRIERVAGHNSKAKTYDALRSRDLERTDTGTSSGSVVAAMRNRYSNNTGSTSPPPRDLPRLPLSVSDLASRYQPGESPTFARPRAVSPPVARQLSLPPLEKIYQSHETTPHQERFTHRPGQSSISGSMQSVEEEASRRRRQRIEELADLEMKEKERELVEREREIEMRARELERDRLRLLNLRDGIGATNSITGGEQYANESPRSQISPLRPRERRSSLRHQLQRPLSQMDLDEAEPSSPSRVRTQFSNSTAQLAPPSPSSNQGRHSGQQQSHSPSPYHHPPLTSSDAGDEHRDRGYPEERPTSKPASPHAPYCGCDTCSVSKYKSSTSPPQRQQQNSPTQSASTTDSLRPPAPADKPKTGWMRRLSMPGMMNSAFSNDSKRNSGSNYALGSGISSNVSSGGKGLLSLDGKKNASTTTFLRPPELDRVQEDGRVERGNGRRSYDSSAAGNRSTTNLGLGSRR